MHISMPHVGKKPLQLYVDSDATTELSAYWNSILSV